MEGASVQITYYTCRLLMERASVQITYYTCRLLMEGASVQITYYTCRLLMEGAPVQITNERSLCTDCISYMLVSLWKKGGCADVLTKVCALCLLCFFVFCG